MVDRWQLEVKLCVNEQEEQILLWMNHCFTFSAHLCLFVKRREGEEKKKRLLAASLKEEHVRRRVGRREEGHGCICSSV